MKRLHLFTLAALAAAGAAAVAFAGIWHRDAPALPVAGSSPAVQPAPPAPMPTRVSLLAGDGHVGLRDGAAAQARFADPYGVALDPRSGTVYVADAGDNNRIRRIAPTGEVSTLAGGAEGLRDGVGAEASFNTPSGLAVDAQGNVYVADTGNHAIRKVTPEGRVSTLAGDGTPGWRDGPAGQARFNGPLAVAVDGQGRVFVADTYNDRIRVITPEGQVSTLAGGDVPGWQDGQGTAARFDTPCGLALDAQGGLWVADTRNDAIRRVDASGMVATLVRGNPQDDEAPMRRPFAVAAGEGGSVITAVGRRGALLRVAASGEVQPLFAEPTQRLSRPTALAIDRAGQVVVADAASRRLHRLVAGTGAVRIDGPLGPAPDQALPDTQHRWPLKPQRAWHELVGTPGEVRGDGQGESRDHLHDGVDVHGDVGAPVLAVADAKVSNPVGTWGFGRLGEGIGLDSLNYIHLRVGRTPRGEVLDPRRFQLLRDAAGKLERVRVRRGTRFAAGDALGTINAMAHVHLSLGVPGYGRNAMALGFEGFSDRQAPHIDGIELFDAAGRRLDQRLGGRVVLPRTADGLQIVVDAWDQVDRNQARRRLGLQSVGFQLLQADGRPASGFEQPRMAIGFDWLPADEAAVKLAYAADSGITVYGSARTRFLYQLNNTVKDRQAAPGTWRTDTLPAGDYTLRVIARDHAGNLASHGTDLAVRLQ